MTLSEVLITLVVIGVLLLLTYPMLKKRFPGKKEESLHKKMNYLVEQVVTDLINDEVSYPQNPSLDQKKLCLL